MIYNIEMIIVQYQFVYVSYYITNEKYVDNFHIIILLIMMMIILSSIRISLINYNLCCKYLNNIIDHYVNLCMIYLKEREREREFVSIISFILYWL